MALRVWLPLNGTLENKGISDYVIQSANITIVDNGKIGKCYSFNGSSSYISITNFNLSNNWSYGCWINTPNSDSRGWEVVMVLNNSGSDADSQFAFWVHQKENRFESLANTQYTSTIPYTNYYNSWHHFFATFNGSLLTTYIDGNVVNTKTITAEYYPATNLTIGARSKNAAGTAFTNWFQGYLNDVRVYDHCLSAKEVKEISQGLILHYKLDGWSGGAGENLLLNSNFSSGTTNNWYGVNSSTITHAVKDGKHTGTGTKGTSANIIAQTEQSYSYIANSIINLTVSADVYVEETGTFGVGHWITTTEASGWQGMSGTRVWNSSSNTLSIGWNHISTTLKNAKNAYNGKIVTAFSYTGATFWITNVKLELGSMATPYSQASADLGIDTTKITDSSGYGNDGTITSTISTQQDSQRYEVSSYLNKKKISCSDGFLTTDDPIFTVSLWFKLYSNITYTAYADLISFTTESYSAQPFRLELCGSPVGQNLMWFRGPSGNTGGFSVGPTWSGWYAMDEWHHIALVSSGNKQYVSYFDGKQTNTFNGSAYTWAPTGGVSIGDTIEGTASMNDFRIYASALSAEDILDLYHTPANIDNLQNIHTFELKDNENTSQILKNGVMATKEFHESNSELLNSFSSGGYAPAKNANNSCVDMGIADFSDYADLNKDLSIHIECDIEWTAFTADTGGTFSGIWWQGSNYKKETSAYAWEGTNYVCSILNSTKSLHNATVVASPGKYHYDVTTTIPASWFNTYSKSYIGFRCDYSDGTGRIDVTNFKITPSQYYNAKIGKDFISANNFIEK